MTKKIDAGTALSFQIGVTCVCVATGYLTRPAWGWLVWGILQMFAALIDAMGA